eukprot:6179422-Amphidinium_carterae.1
MSLQVRPRQKRWVFKGKLVQSPNLDLLNTLPCCYSASVFVVWCSKAAPFGTAEQVRCPLRLCCMHTHLADATAQALSP